MPWLERPILPVVISSHTIRYLPVKPAVRSSRAEAETTSANRCWTNCVGTACLNGRFAGQSVPGPRLGGDQTRDSKQWHMSRILPVVISSHTIRHLPVKPAVRSSRAEAETTSANRYWTNCASTACLSGRFAGQSVPGPLLGGDQTRDSKQWHLSRIMAFVRNEWAVLDLNQ